MTSIFRRKGRKGYTLKHRDVDGRWRFEQFTTRQQAEDRALELRQAPETSRSMLFRDYATTWLKRAEQHVRPGTHKVYSSMVTAHLSPAFGHLPLREVTRARVKDFVASKLAAGMARKYVVTIRSTLHTLLEEAREDGLLVFNPASRLRSAGPEKVQVPPKAMDADQLRRFLAAAPPRWWALFRLMSLTGLRLGEALAIKWEDVDLEGKVLHVRRGYTRGKVQPTKSGREREVDLAAVLVEELQRYDVQQKTAAMKSGARAPWLFPSDRGTGRPVDHVTIRGAFRSATKRAGLPPHLTPHCLRHTFASLLLTRGHSMYYVQRMLGHATITMTVNTYGSWLPAGNQAIVDDLATVTTNVTRVPSKTRISRVKTARFGRKQRGR